MNVIFKYPVNPKPGYIDLPKGSKFLSVQAQHNMPKMWFEINTFQTETEKRYFITRPTGEGYIVQGNEQFLGTFQLEGGSLVFHLFEVLP